MLLSYSDRVRQDDCVVKIERRREDEYGILTPKPLRNRLCA